MCLNSNFSVLPHSTVEYGSENYSVVWVQLYSFIFARSLHWKLDLSHNIVKFLLINIHRLWISMIITDSWGITWLEIWATHCQNYYLDLSIVWWTITGLPQAFNSRKCSSSFYLLDCDYLFVTKGKRLRAPL